FFSSRRRHTRFSRDWSSDVCSSDLLEVPKLAEMGAELVEAGGLAERIETSFEPSGRLRDDASGTLASLRDRVRSLHQRIKSELEIGRASCRESVWRSGAVV